METLSSVLPQNPVLYARPTAATTKLSGVQSSKWPRLYGMGKGQTFHHMIPHVAHMRLTPVSAPVHTVRVRPSVILAEIDRIQHKMRPSMSYQPEEDFLNTRSIMSFDDETRSIRAHTAALLKRIHEPLPRARRIFPITVTTYQETPIPERITSDTYIRRLLGPTTNVKQDIVCMSHYDEPAKRFMGKGHLACVSFAGGRAFPRRKNYYYDDDDRVKNDVKYLSLYRKNREAAEAPVSNEAATLSGDWYHNLAAKVKPERAAPKSRFYRPTHIPDIAEPAAPTRVETQNNLKEALNKKKLEQRDEEARIAELARQEQLAKEATMERQKQLQKKAQEEAERKAEEQRKEEERRAEEQRRQAELERQAAEKKVEEERKEAERKAEEERKEAERKAEEERKEAERKAEEERQEAERKAEEERQEAERKAEEERQEAERKAELERQAAEEEDKQAEEKVAVEEEQKQSEQEVPIDQAPVEESKTEPEEPEVVVEDKVAEEVVQDVEVTSPGPEPLVEEPVSPSDQQPQSSSVEIQEAVTTEDEDA